MTTPPIPPPTWGARPSRSDIDDAAQRGRVRSSATRLLVAAVLHGIAGGASWLLVPVVIKANPVPGFAEAYTTIATVGLILQIGFAASAGAGFVILWRGSQNIAALGTTLLVLGILAAVVSLLVFGGLLGLIAGILTAYAGNKVRRPPVPAWIPPTSWMPPPSTPPP